MGSKTFSVYYNPYSDKSMLYEINKKEFSYDDIEKLLVKLEILQKECKQLSDIVCDNSDIYQAISRINKIKENTNIYDKYKILLTSQEIYDKNKYNVKKEYGVLVAAGTLMSMSDRNAIANRIRNPRFFFNDQQIIYNNQLYKTIEKLYYYILSLDFKRIKNKDQVINNYVILYNSIKKDIETFFKAQSILEVPSSLQRTLTLPKTPSLSLSSSSIPTRSFTGIAEEMLLAAGQSPEKINSPPPKEQSQYPPFYKDIVGDGLCLFRSILYSISQLSTTCKKIILDKINFKLEENKLNITDLEYDIDNQTTTNIIETCRKLAIITYQELMDNIPEKNRKIKRKQIKN
jgi:hypothetical protein